jgi:hypothetical protein
MLFSLHLFIPVGPIDFGPTNSLKRYSQDNFLSFQWLDPITQVFTYFHPHQAAFAGSSSVGAPKW